RDHVSAVVAQVLDRLLAGHVSLVRLQDREHEDERPDDQPDHPALEAPVILEGECGPGGGHATRCRLLVQILMGGSIGDKRKAEREMRSDILRIYTSA